MDRERGIERFQDYLTEMGRSPKTVRDYVGTIVRLDMWACERGYDAASIPPYLLMIYAEGEVPLKKSPREVFRQAVRHYWAAIGRGDESCQYIRVPKEDPAYCRALSPEDARRVFKDALAWVEGPEGLGVLLGLHQGFRAAEIAGARWDWIDDDWARIRVVGKGCKESTLPLHPVVVEKLKWWREWGRDLAPTDPRTRPGEEWVFAAKAGHGDGHVTPTTVWTWVKRLGRSVGVEVTTHQLRHTFGAEINDRTKDLRATQKLMRHSKSSTTERYTRVGWDRMLEGLMSADYGEG